MLKLFKRDSLKLIIFLLLVLAICLLTKYVNVLWSGLAFLLCGVLPYWANQREMKGESLLPYIIWGIVVILLNIAEQFVPVWWQLVLAALEVLSFIVLVLAVQYKQSFSARLCVEYWRKTLVFLGVWFLVELVLFPAVFMLLRNTPLQITTGLLMPLTCIGLVYGFATSKN